MTIGPSREAVDDLATVGVAAHICAASSGGPRFDATMSSDQRSSIENGIWLCSRCATLIDRDVVRFTVEALQAWKREHESYVERNIGVAHTREATPTLNGRRITVEAARIAAERAMGWEHRLFAQLLRDEIRSARDAANNLGTELLLGRREFLAPEILLGRSAHR